MSHILIVEDEPQIAAFVARGLRAAGYDVTAVEDGASGLQRAGRGDVDLVLLDIGLPDMGGFDVLRRLRERDTATPVIILTARTGTGDTVAGLDAGASDYVGKPFVFEELLARVRSRLRERDASEVVVTRDDVTLDILGRRATVAGHEVELSAREFALAEYFLRNAGTVVTRDELLRRVWGLDFDPGSNIVDVYVRYLRGKLGADRIITVRGAGYRWA